MAKLTVGLLRRGERSLDALTQLLLASLSLRVALLDALASLIAHPPLELVVPPLYGVYNRVGIGRLERRSLAGCR